ncbi:MAG: 2Fe-2S iron-sulfur cluster-binding protein [Acidobacteriota bacterium]
MPNFKLNGREVDYREGELLIEAAARHGAAIPHYCYHPDLSSPANCRACLVEMAGAPKLIPSCQWTVNEKMEIFTESEKVQQAQRDVLEYLLINHPLDCPICDQAGECKLQQYAYLFGPDRSSMEEPKVELDKRKTIGPRVVLDQERCISCTRCVRFLEEVTETAELAMSNRGHHSCVDVHENRSVDNDYSGNIVDMCPVGALTNKSFRFESRVWYLHAVDTTCSGCSRGCNETVDWRAERRGLPRIRRIRARRNPAVNKSFICDSGRFMFEDMDKGERPVHARGGRAAEHGPGKNLVAAQANLGQRLRALANDKESGFLGVLVSGAETMEELEALATLARALDPKALLTCPAVEDGDLDDILKRKDRQPNRNGARALGYGDDVDGLASRSFVLVVDADMRLDHGLPADLVGKAAGGGDWAALTAHERSWEPDASLFLPLANAFEKSGLFLNFDGIVQRVQQVVPAPAEARDLVVHVGAIAIAAGVDEVAFGGGASAGRLVATDGPLAGLDLDALGKCGAKKDADAWENLEEPSPLFSSAPRSYAEGEYQPFLDTSTPPPAVHVAAGGPSQLNVPVSTGRGLELPVLSLDPPAESESTDDAGEDA